MLAEVRCRSALEMVSRAKAEQCAFSLVRAEQVGHCHSTAKILKSVQATAQAKVGLLKSLQERARARMAALCDCTVLPARTRREVFL